MFHIHSQDIFQTVKVGKCYSRKPVVTVVDIVSPYFKFATVLVSPNPRRTVVNLPYRRTEHINLRNVVPSNVEVLCCRVKIWESHARISVAVQVVDLYQFEFHTFVLCQVEVVNLVDHIQYVVHHNETVELEVEEIVRGHIEVSRKHLCLYAVPLIHILFPEQFVNVLGAGWRVKHFPVEVKFLRLLELERISATVRAYGWEIVAHSHISASDSPTEFLVVYLV